MKLIRPIYISIILTTFSLNAQQPTDCSNAIIVCGNSNVVLDANGTYNRQRMPATDYWFVTDLVQGSKHFQVKGHFTLRPREI